MIRFVGVSQTFAGRKEPVEALRRIDLEVDEGEFVAILGRSGCGKSTLLRIAAGLLAPTDGAVYLDDRVVREPRRDVSMVFQKPALLPWRSVLDNVMLPIEVFGWDRRMYRSRAMDLLDTLGLGGFENKLPHELSGGMQQRAALCRSLLVEPRALLMDEPFSALDALTREDLSVLLQKVHMDHGSTVLFVTHSINEAVLLADRVVVLTPRPGRLLEELTIGIPRPRSLGKDSHHAEVAQLSSELHETLLTDASASV